MKRTEHKKDIIEALTKAQKIAFAPLSFQAIAALLDFGILKELDMNEATKEDLQEKLSLSEYTVSTLLETALAIGVISENNEKYQTTLLGQMFLYDEMTRVNFNFTKDVCYKGAQKLKESFLQKNAEGLKEYGFSGTIYPHLSKLPDDMKQSWYEFDHYYSDNSFDIIYKIISPVDKIYDIGANTGRFEKVCLKHNKNQDLTLIDLAQNIDVIKKDSELQGCKFHAANILEETDNLPKMSGAVIMSQFLDCFSKEQIRFILQKIVKSSSDDIKIYILEPFIDRQKFEAAKYSLIHTSLYFTCMANGCSKMYSYKDMEKLIQESDLKIKNVYDSLGAHDYTLLECVKNV